LLYIPRLTTSCGHETVDGGKPEGRSGERSSGRVPSFHIPNISTLEAESVETMLRTPPHAPQRPPPRRVTGANPERCQSEDEESNISSPLLRTPKRRRRMPRTSTPVKVLVMAATPPSIDLSAVVGDVPFTPIDVEEEEEGEDDVILVEEAPDEEVETTDPEKDSGVGSQEENDD